MMKCPICNKEMKNGRALHAHMMKSHMEEYREKGCKLSAFGIEKEQLEKTAPPDDFRPLNLSDQLEKIAYDEGYRYFSGGSAYKAAECRKLGWIS